MASSWRTRFGLLSLYSSHLREPTILSHFSILLLTHWVLNNHVYYLGYFLPKNRGGTCFQEKNLTHMHAGTITRGETTKKLNREWRMLVIENLPRSDGLHREMFLCYALGPVWMSRVVRECLSCVWWSKIVTKQQKQDAKRFRNCFVFWHFTV